MKTNEIFWEKHTDKYELGLGEVHIWRYKRDLLSEDIGFMRNLLSRDEIQKAEKQYFEVHKKGYILNRGMLRILLSNYLQEDPREISFQYNSRGKPFILHDSFKVSLHFNVAHSNELALYLLTDRQLAGVDIEYINPNRNMIDIAKRYFFQCENELIRPLTDIKKKEVFYLLWTCKEAYLKATGEGLKGLENVKIVYHDKSFGIALKNRHDFNRLKGWTLYPFKVTPGYVGAVAIKGRKCNFRFINLDFRKATSTSSKWAARSFCRRKLYDRKYNLP